MNLVESVQDDYIARAEQALLPLKGLVSVTLDTNWDNDQYVELEDIHAMTHRQGHGTQAMNIICALADEMGVTLTLGVANETDGIDDEDPSEDALIGWYMGFGFEQEWSLSDRVTMKRTPA